MKIPLNNSIRKTKEQRRGILSLIVPIGLVLVVVSQYYLQSLERFIPNSGLSEVFDNASLILVILLILAYCYFVEKRRPETLGFVKKNALKGYLVGVLIGFLFITSIYIINLATSSIDTHLSISTVKWWYIILSLVGFFFQGLMEEVVCRGFIMNSIASKIGVLAGIIINSIIFSLMHGFNDGYSLLAAINLFLAGVFFSVIFYYTDSIFVVGAIHASWNFFVGPFYGVKISGYESYSPIFTTVGKSDYSLINGGEFGFEGGLPVTIVLTLIILVVIYLIKLKENKKGKERINEQFIN